MMIRAVRANHASFRAVTFEPGFNVILADKTDKSTRKDSRNGVGKSLLLEIIHFCLGGRKVTSTSLKKAELKSWSFTLDLLLDGHEASVTRSLEHPGRLLLNGDLSFVPPDFEAVAEAGGLSIRGTAWTKLLGHLTFGLSLSDIDEPFAPRFRNLFPFFARSARPRPRSPGGECSFGHSLRCSVWCRRSVLYRPPTMQDEDCLTRVSMGSSDSVWRKRARPHGFGQRPTRQGLIGFTTRRLLNGPGCQRSGNQAQWR
jgi:hypothetical protein